jgi:amino acid transporter
MKKLAVGRPRGGLGGLQATALALSFVVGSGVLVLPVLVLNAVGPARSLQAWILTTLIGIPLVGLFYRMALKEKNTLSDAFTGAFGKGATRGARLTVLAALLFAMPAMTYSTSLILGDLFGGPGLSPALLAHGLLSLLCLNQIRPLRRNSKVSLVSAFLLFFVIGAAVVVHPGDIVHGFEITARSAPRFDTPLLRACTLSFFGYVGWESLSFFTTEVRNPKRDLKWVYFGSFTIVSAFYLALTAAMTGLAAKGVPFNLHDSFLPLLPTGSARVLARATVLVLLVANLNAWIYGGARQMREALGPERSSHLGALLVYYGIASLGLIAIETHLLDLSTLFLLSNQNWIVIYAGILAYAWKRSDRKSDRLLVVSGAVGFAFLLAGCSPALLLTALFFLPEKPFRKIKAVIYDPILGE